MPPMFYLWDTLFEFGFEFSVFVLLCLFIIMRSLGWLIIRN